MQSLLIAILAALAADQPAQPNEETRHSRPVTFAAFSPDSTVLATAAQDGTVRIWRSSDCELVRTLAPAPGEKKLPYLAVAFDRSGGKLAAFSHVPNTVSHLTVWEAETGRRELFLNAKGHSLGVPMSGIAFSPDGSEVFCLGGRYAYFWNLRNKTASTQFQTVHLAEGKAFYTESGPLISLGREGMFFIEPRPDRWRLSYRKDTLVWGELLPKGKFVARTFKGVIEVIDQRTKRVEQEFIPRSGPAVYCAVELHGGGLIVMTEVGKLERWSLADGSFSGMLDQGIASTSMFDKTIYFGSGKPPRSFGFGEHPTSLLISNDGKTVCYVAGQQFAILPAKWELPRE